MLTLGALAAIGLAAAPVDLTFEGVSPDGDVAADDGSRPTVTPLATPTDPLEELDTTVDVADWERLADCESGDWDRHGVPESDSARWDYGLEFDHGDHFEGGLNFHPDTWASYRDPDMPPHAGRASQVEEIEVAERVLDDQGWNAWPVCSEKVDLPE